MTLIVEQPERVLEQLASLSDAAPASWGATWKELELAAHAAIDTVLDESELSEPWVARRLSALEDPIALVCSSSMPVRDLEWFGRSVAAPATVHSNRGANGIDGVVSTALGVTAASPSPVILLIGDLAFLHDVSALVDGLEGEGSLTIVVLDNDGGGIFSFLPQRGGLSTERFEQLFGTPRGVSVARVAEGFGLAVRSIASKTEFEEALDQVVGVAGVSVLIVNAPFRDDNVALHGRLTQAITDSVTASLS
jgi:2-succinyl-5-enolpyruvyl-6-hydroxy-3-cyclohexene-1-carboxylate synthase